MLIKSVYNEGSKIVKNSFDKLSKITKKDIQDHLSKHYTFYKTAAVGLIALGSILSLSMLGSNWDKISEKMSEFLFRGNNIVSNTIFNIFDFSTDGILFPCYEIAENLFDVYTSSHVFRAISYLTATTFMTAGITAFLALNIPNIISILGITIAAHLVPMIPGTVLSITGGVLWDYTQKQNG